MKAERLIKTNNKNTDNTIRQGSILAAASIISRIIGMLYRIPVNEIIGDKGAGLYSFAFEVYSYALILSTFCVPLAVSKLLSARFASREYKNGMKLFKGLMIFSLAAGSLMAILVFAFAPLIEKVMGYEGLVRPLRVLAPTILVVSIAGAFRGFFQSRKTMLPTAVSQLGEQIINAIVSIVAPLALITLAVTETDHASYGAMGSTMGTLFGALAGTCFLVFLYVIYKPRMAKHLSHDQIGVTITSEESAKLIAMTILPIVMSQAIYQSTGILDGTIFGLLYKKEGVDTEALYNLFSGKYRLLTNVPIAISSSLASSLIPTLVGLYTVGNMTEFKKRLGASMKFNMIFAFPCAVGLTVLATPIMHLLFGATEYEIPAKMLNYGSIAVIFYALSTVSNAALQGMDRLNVPLRNAAISLVLHIIVVVLLLLATDLGPFALVIGNITYPLVVCILNWMDIARYSNYKQEVKKTFLLPALCSVAMGVLTWIVCKIIGFIIGNSRGASAVIVLIGMVLAIILYFLMIFLSKTLVKEDMADFPMGMRIYRVAKKLHLME